MQKRWLTRNVFWLGMVSLFTDTASDMVIPLLPLFVMTTLHGSALAVGMIEGFAEATASVLKLVSGRWADHVRRYRPFVLAGYSLSSLARPLVALAAVPWHVVAVRMADRVGKGLRSTPRDVLLAAAVPPERRGAAFGFHRAMDHSGAVLGPLAAYLVLTTWTRDLRTIFWLAAIPGALAVLAALAVSEQPRAPGGDAMHVAEASPPESRAVLARFLVPLGLFTLGNASDVFLLVLAQGRGTSVEALPILWMALHVVKTLSSLLGGRLSDWLGHRRVIAAGWLVYAAIYTAFAFAETQAAIMALFVVYGVHHGLSEAAEKALVAEMVPAGRRGSGYGWYYLTQGALALAASLLFGALWQLVGPRAAFLVGAGLAAAAVAALVALAPRALSQSSSGRP